MNLEIFKQELPVLLIVILVVLLARAISIYLSLYLSNNLTFFRNEPNIPVEWQHILVWGGLRGVIPLVLVYSLPESFAFKQTMLSFTFATLLFTLFINGLSIKSLLIRLKLHLPGQEEKIISEELKLFKANEARKKLQSLAEKEFDQDVIRSVNDDLTSLERKYKQRIVRMADSDKFIYSVQLESIMIERQTLHKLFEQGRFTEPVLHEFESELDQQQDSIEYPNLYKVQNINKTGKLNTKLAFRKRLAILRRFIVKYRLLAALFRIDEKDIILERYSLLRARLFTSFAVLEYLQKLEQTFQNNQLITEAVKKVRLTQQRYVNRNQKEADELLSKYPDYITQYQREIIEDLIAA